MVETTFSLTPVWGTTFRPLRVAYLNGSLQQNKLIVEYARYLIKRTNQCFNTFFDDLPILQSLN